MLAALLCATTAQADPIEEFYKGKTVTIVTSTGVGGPFDLTARALAKHMPKYLPGRPTMIVRSMPGGGDVLATNYVHAGAKDGTALGVVNNIIRCIRCSTPRRASTPVASTSWARPAAAICSPGSGTPPASRHG